jgi:UDP-glucose 4-epimerase
MNWLITGGSGYIGRNLIYSLRNSQNVVYSIDKVQSPNLSSFSPSNFFLSDIGDSNVIRRILDECQIDGVVHLAALKSVPESLQFPKIYREENYQNTERLIDIAIEMKVKSFIFASSAAVYGSAKPNSANLYDETIKCLPTNPYGQTKLDSERLLSEKFSGTNLNYLSLRFFNVMGTLHPELKDESRSNVIPIFIDRALSDKSFSIFGDQYPTPDGSCVRDYVTIHQVVETISQAMQRFDLNQKLPPIVNLATGSGLSVIHLANLIKDAFGSKSTIEIDRPREGDLGSVVADVSLMDRVFSTGDFPSMVDILMSLK